MKKIYEEFLECLCKNQESIFPIDSPQISKKPLNKEYTQEDIDNMISKRLLIDFDGVIHNFSRGWDDGTIYDPPKEGAKEAIDKLKNDYEIIIFTTRASVKENGIDEVKKQIENMKKFLKKYDIHYDDITGEKIAGIAYIDDNAIKFTDWNNFFENDYKNLKEK